MLQKALVHRLVAPRRRHHVRLQQGWFFRRSVRLSTTQRRGLALQVGRIEVLVAKLVRGQVLKVVGTKDGLARQFAGSVAFVLGLGAVVIVFPNLKARLLFLVRMVLFVVFLHPGFEFVHQVLKVIVVVVVIVTVQWFWRQVHSERGLLFLLLSTSSILQTSS